VKKIKICIVGCGAIGTWLGAHLANSPLVELNCLVRKSYVAPIQELGLRVTFKQSPDSETLVGQPLLVTDQAQELGPQDWIIIAIKATSLQSLVPQLSSLIAENSRIWTAMNGLPWWFMRGLKGPLSNHCFKSIDPTGAVERAFPLKHWVGGVVHASCSLHAVGHAVHHFGKGLIVGDPVNSDASISAQVNQLTHLLKSVGLDAIASSTIQKDIWYKLWGNMTMNPISALTGVTTDKILDDPLLIQFVSQVMQEAKTIGRGIGLPIDQTPEERHLMTRKLGAFKTSMLQDVEHKRPVELDVLLSAVLELAALANIQTPFTNALMGLSRVQLQGLGLYASAS
jgi:2-dehydropantoate 2-reductase